MQVQAHSGEFNCRKCPHKHCDDNYARPGSKGPAPFAKWVIKDVIETRTCLLPMVTDQSWALLRLARHYRNHYLPFAGGLMEQPNLFLQAMEILDVR